MARRTKRSETSDAAPRSGLSGKRKAPIALSDVEGPGGVLIGIALAEIAETAETPIPDRRRAVG